MDSPQTIEISTKLLPQLYLVIAFTFLIGLTVIFFCVFYIRRLYRKEFEIQQIKNEHKQSLLQANLESQEKERARIASELHDDIGANLSTVKLYISHLEEQETQPGSANFPKVRNMIEETIKSVRHISHNLSPENLHQFGLISAIRRLCENVEDASNINVNFSSTERITMEKTYELHFYRIVQELINNTQKHANASTINLSLLKKGKQLTLEYKDNGKGIKTSNEKNTPFGLGMKNIQSRSEIIGANIEFPDTTKGFHIKLVSPNE